MWQEEKKKKRGKETNMTQKTHIRNSGIDTKNRTNIKNLCKSQLSFD